MKHSNWILGIGVIVAIILIVSSILLKTEARAAVSLPVVDSPATLMVKPPKNIIVNTIKDISNRILYLVK